MEIFTLIGFAVVLGVLLGAALPILVWFARLMYVLIMLAIDYVKSKLR